MTEQAEKPAAPTTEHVVNQAREAYDALTANARTMPRISAQPPAQPEQQPAAPAKSDCVDQKAAVSAQLFAQAGQAAERASQFYAMAAAAFGGHYQSQVMGQAHGHARG